MEVSGSKRRIPKPTFAKALRVVIQRAEETKFPGEEYSNCFLLVRNRVSSLLVKTICYLNLSFSSGYWNRKIA